jgi:hypothetical protein
MEKTRAFCIDVDFAAQRLWRKHGENTIDAGFQRLWRKHTDFAFPPIDADFWTVHMNVSIYGARRVKQGRPWNSQPCDF